MILDGKCLVQHYSVFNQAQTLVQKIDRQTLSMSKSSTTGKRSTMHVLLLNWSVLLILQKLIANSVMSVMQLCIYLTSDD